jgi:hypothetical protein
MPRTWEHPIDGEHSKNLPNISEAPGPTCTLEMEKFIRSEEMNALRKHSNMATQLLATQSKRLKSCGTRGTSRISATWNSTTT